MSAPLDSATIPESLEPQAFGLQFRWHTDHHTLIADYTPAEGQPTLTLATLRALLTAAGLQQIPLFERELHELVVQQRNQRACILEIGGDRDARVEVFVSRDQLLAGLRIDPACGNGAPLSHEQLQHALAQAGVVQGIQTDMLEQIVATAQDPGASSQERCYVVAYGKPARPGRDAVLEPLVKDAADRRPQETEDGRIDFRDRGEFPTVTEGTPLVRRHPPIPGTEGYTVTGQALTPPAPHDFKLHATGRGTRLSAQDPDVLEASSAGLPVILPQGAKVEPILKLAAVDLASGHVRFDGSVHVSGGISPGMQVQVSGDLRVGGTVEGATLEAGGSIHINGGILGHTPLRDAQGRPTAEAAVIKAGSSLEANFIQHAIVECTGSVRVKKLIMHCELKAQGSVKLARRGQIIGGHIQAGTLIEADTLGSSAAVKTVLEVGPADELRQQLETCLQLRQQRQEQLAQLRTVLVRLKRKGTVLPPSKAQKYQQAWRQLQQDLQAREQHCRELEQALIERRQARIRAGHEAHPGCRLIIAGFARNLINPIGKATFRLQGNEIKVQ